MLEVVLRTKVNVAVLAHVGIQVQNGIVCDKLTTHRRDVSRPVWLKCTITLQQVSDTQLPMREFQ